MVEHSAHNPKSKGLNPAGVAGPGKQKVTKKIYDRKKFCNTGACTIKLFTAVRVEHLKSASHG